jgi:hypothetical protein
MYIFYTPNKWSRVPQYDQKDACKCRLCYEWFVHVDVEGFFWKWEALMRKITLRRVVANRVERDKCRER